MRKIGLVSLDTLRELYFGKKRYNFKEYKISKDSDKSLRN